MYVSLRSRRTNSGDAHGAEVKSRATAPPAPIAAPGHANRFLHRLCDGDAATNDVIQGAWATRPYQVSNAQRTMHTDVRAVKWGATGNAGAHQNHKDLTNRPRAVLHETMATPNAGADLLNRYGASNDTWDVGLSIVLNRAYTPAKVYKNDGNVTATNSTKGDNENTVKQTLDNDFGTFANWNGPPLQIVTAAWERREIKENLGNATSLEVVQGSVPYSSLRYLAAQNSGGAAIEAELRSNHDDVWHRMGDNDMAVVRPNAVTPEMAVLGEVEQSGKTYQKNTLVTFGYDLTTAGTNQYVTQALARIYSKEMALRDAIAALDAPLYPSEPTTYYRSVQPGSMDTAWGEMEKQKVGGSGQQLEGAKLAKALNDNGGFHHITRHAIAPPTSAGARNDELVALFNNWYANGAGDPANVDAGAIEAAINNLDQSALRHDEYLSKVPTNLGLELKQETFEKIKGLVVTYRKEAAADAASAIRVPLAYARMIAADNQRKNAKFAVH